MKSLVSYINENKKDYTSEDFYKGWDLKKAMEDIESKDYWELHSDNKEFVIYYEKGKKSMHNMVSLNLEKGKDGKVARSFKEFD